MAEGKGTPTTPKQEKEAQQSKPWTLKEWWGKSVWEWMQLFLQLFGALAIPLIIAYVGLRFNAELDARQQQLAEQRTQDLTLQTYLDQMSTLVLEDLGSRKVQVLMRARTLTALDRLDPSRKTEIMTFLAEADLVNISRQRLPVISLNDADLHNAKLVRADLIGAKLEYANLSGAKLIGGSLQDASLFEADLSDATMSSIFLTDTDLSHADLSGAKLKDVTLQQRTGLYKTDLRGANLEDTGITNEKLVEMVSGRKLLEGATMPNGQKYEEWFKDKEAGGKDEKNE
jgi:uncharacterized protein YjbI with pentapeptide repeats